MDDPENLIKELDEIKQKANQVPVAGAVPDVVMPQEQGFLFFPSRPDPMPFAKVYDPFFQAHQYKMEMKARKDKK